MLSKYKSSLEPVLKIVCLPFCRIDPNLITLAGMLFPVLFLYFMVSGRVLLALICLGGVSFDAIDGMVARKTKRESRFGGVLDSTADRVSDAVIIVSFLLAGFVRLWIVLSVLVFSYLISYIRSRAELAGENRFKLTVGLIERGERIAVFFVAAAACLFFPTADLFGYNPAELIFIVLAGLSLITVIQRLLTAKKLLA